MFARLLLAFIIIPLVDLVILVHVGGYLGFGATIAIVVVTGFAGAALAKRQGLRTLNRINAELTAGKMPTSELADGVLILLAGAVLITPGFLTDAFGLLLLVPAFRKLLKGALGRYFRSRIVVTDLHGHREPEAGPGSMPDITDSPPVDAARPSGRPAKYVENEALHK